MGKQTTFQVLGPVTAVVDGSAVALGGPKQRALLATLLLAEGTAVPRHQLVLSVWGDDPPASAAQSLQVYVHNLRKALGADRIETAGTGYLLPLEPDELDLARCTACSTGREPPRKAVARPTPPTTPAARSRSGRDARSPTSARNRWLLPKELRSSTSPPSASSSSSRRPWPRHSASTPAKARP